MSSWNNKPFREWEFFIEMVQKRPYLYKKSEPNYSVRDVVRTTWDGIAISMTRAGYGAMDGEEAKKLWASLKRKFSEERKASKSKSGDPAKSREVWCLYTRMAFMVDYMTERNRAQKRSVTQIPGFDEDSEADTVVMISVDDAVGNSGDDDSAQESYGANDLGDGEDISARQQTASHQQSLPNALPPSLATMGSQSVNSTTPSYKRKQSESSPSQARERSVSGETASNSSALSRPPSLATMGSQSVNSTMPSYKRKQSESSPSQARERSVSGETVSNSSALSRLIQSTEKAMNRTCDAPKVDRAYLVGQLVTTKMRKYSELAQIHIEKKINDVLFDAEIEHCPTQIDEYMT